MNTINIVVIRIELIVAQFIADKHAEQDKNSESDHEIRQVDQSKHFVVQEIPVNADEKIFDHNFDFSNGFDNCYSIFTNHTIILII